MQTPAAQASRIQLSLIQARQTHRLHRVNMLEPGICRINKGTKRVFLGEQSVAIHTGQWLLLPAHTPLDVENEPGPQGYFAQMLNFESSLISEFYQQYAQHLPKTTQQFGLQQWRIEQNVRLDITWQRLLQSLAEQEAPLLQKHLLYELLLVLGLSGQLWQLLDHSDTKLSMRIQQLLISDPAASWSQDTVAQHFHMSSPTLRRHLSAEGQTFRSILNSVRMAHALGHLQTTRQSIEDIAHACGYTSASRFSSRFREQFGLSPKALRKAI